MTHCNHCGRRVEYTACPCLSERINETTYNILLESSETELREAMGDEEFEAEATRGQQSLQPMDLTPDQAAELQSNLDAGTARPKIERSMPSRDDKKWNEDGSHFNVWTLGGIVVVALLICYFTESYPWINGVLKF